MGNSDRAGRRVEESPTRPSNVAATVQWGQQKGQHEMARRRRPASPSIRQHRIVETVEVLVLKSSPMEPIICPPRRNRGQGEALWQVEWEDIRPFLDMATFQNPDNAKLYLREIVTLVEEGAAPPGWRDRVATEYPQLVPLLDNVFQYDVYGDLRKPARSGHNRRLTQEQSKLIANHLPLVKKLAHQRASQGGRVLDDALLDELEGIGFQVLEDQICRWDSSRGVSFGAFVKERLAGAMHNHLSRNRVKTESLDDDAINKYRMSEQFGLRAACSPDDPREKWKWEADRTRTKDNRTSTGGRKVKSYAESPARHPLRLIKKNSAARDAALVAALEQLTPNERVVFEGRLLANPQVSLGELAAKLDVERSRIVALEKSARRRMGELLKG
jgi:RNA polymerase sigma factor (sigma-70 family)